jgi:hypothetical protein
MDQLSEMKGWKSYLLWEGLPFLMLLFIFGCISAVNWAYESKLITLDNGASDWAGVHMGPIFLAMAAGFAVAASLILFIVRVTRPKSGGGWYMFISLTLIAIFLIFPAIFIIILGPACIEMIEQARGGFR